MPQLPNGFDRADGQEGRLGKASPADSIKVSDGQLGSEVSTQEHPDSPEIERAEQATLTHRFNMSWDEAVTRIQSLGRGTILQDSYGNVTKVLSSRLQRNPGKYATLSVVSEGVSFDSPPDQFRVDPVELGVNILKHPRYFYALQGNNPTERLKNQAVIRELQNYFENVTSQYRDYLSHRMLFSLSDSSNDRTGSVLSNGAVVGAASYTPSGQDVTVSPIPGTNMAKRAALEIIEKYWRGEETPYVVGWQITWSQFYWRPQYLNPGGYVEDPITQATPQLPPYFGMVDEALGTSIFSALHSFNPQSYSSNGDRDGFTQLSWLRKADAQEEQRTWFKVDRTWVGSPIGYWDTDLYNQDKRPTNDFEFNLPSVPSNPKKPSNAV